MRNLKLIHDEDPKQDLKQLLVNGVYVTDSETYGNGASTVVMAKFDEKEPGVLKTATLGNSGYTLLQPTPDKKQKVRTMYTSKPQY